MTVSEPATVIGKVVACRSCGVSTLAMRWPLPCQACGKSLGWGVVWPRQGDGSEAWSDARRRTAAVLTIWAHRLESLEALVFADNFGSDESREIARDRLAHLKTDLTAERSNLHTLSAYLHPVMAALYAPAIRRVLETLSVRINSRDVEAWRCCVFAAVGEISYHLSEIW